MTPRIPPGFRGLVLAAALFGFLAVLVARHPPLGVAGGVRAPEQVRLAALIRAEQQRTARLRTSVAAARERIHAIEQALASSRGAIAGVTSDLAAIQRTAGLVPVAGPAITVALDDSKQREPPPGGTVNDLVIHSQDVQAVANGLWAAGAEAVAVNGERVVPTSALLCVGNTLLINGTVHSPPYRFTAIGDPERLRGRFLADPLVARLRADVERFALGFSVSSLDEATVPAYRGRTDVRFARRT
jgi:uncharacterized protein YlxW (UPF0749 family)